MTKIFVVLGMVMLFSCSEKSTSEKFQDKVEEVNEGLEESSEDVEEETEKSEKGIKGLFKKK